MIIGFCGRMQSGKTELAKVCEDNGYTKIYFALPLKKLCAEILDIDIPSLNRAKCEGTDIALKINNDICDILANETEIPLETVKEICYGKTINTVREMLQFIGTDLIRKYNQDWHVNRIKSMLDKDTNYVIDDVRFQNEKKMIEDMGGDVWFVTRTTLDNISNHISETSITWRQCWNKIIINDTTLSKFIFKWEVFLDNYARSCAIRDKEFNRILEDGLTDEMTHLSVLDVLMIPKALFTYTPREFEKDEIEYIKMNADKTVTIKYNNESYEIVENPLTIEDLKMLVK